MEKKIGELKDLKEGKYVLVEGEPCKVTSVTHSKPGKHGGAKARITAEGIFDSQKRNLLGPVSQKVKIPIIHKKTAQVLSIVKDSVQLMDMDSYETFELPLPGELKEELSEGDSVLYLSAGAKKKILKKQ